jgi:chaperonin GroEL
VIVSKDKTIILKSTLKVDSEKVTERVNQLREAHATAKRKNDKDFFLERIASLTGGIGVIFAGGNTDLEQKELYDRIDDSVCAVRSALEEGILPGGGKALYEVDILEMIGELKSEEQGVAAAILQKALRSPLEQILENAGLKVEDYYSSSVVEGFGLNVKTGELGDLIRMGVTDPLKVTRSALQNAVSVATTILSTNAIITMARTYDAK